jgi:hypothetical protein
MRSAGAGQRLLFGFGQREAQGEAGRPSLSALQMNIEQQLPAAAARAIVVCALGSSVEVPP